uniref:ABC transporter permease subunit n=1 Tax=candidate division WOR-3 bacterium TaxID=2052148 RepID=A0A7V4E539_UNCW3
MKKGFDVFVGIFSVIGILLFVIPGVYLLFSTSPASLFSAVKDDEFLRAVGVSLSSATLSTLLILLFGTPLAYVLSRSEFPLRGLLENLLELPVAIPHSVAGVAILNFFGRGAFMGKILNLLGFEVYGTLTGIVIAMAFVSAPYFIGSLKEGLRQLPQEYEKISYSLGRGRFYTFFKVLLPMTKGHLLKGLILSWGRAVSEFGAVMVVAYFPMTSTVFVYERLETMGIRATLPYAVLLFLITGFVFLFLRILWGKYAESKGFEG